MTASSSHVSDDRTGAWADAHEPGTTSARLAEIVGRYPEFAAAVVRHPNSYPELEKWAQSSGLLRPAPGAPAVPSVSGADPVGVRSAEGGTWGQPASETPPSVAVVPEAAKDIRPELSVRRSTNDGTAVRRDGDALWLPPAGTTSPTPAPPTDPEGVRTVGRIELGVALKYGWRKYAEDPWPFVLMILITLGLVFVSYLAAGAMVGAIILGALSTSNVGVVVFLVALTSLIPTFVGLALSIGLVRASIDTVRGRPVSVGSSFRRDALGQYLAFWVLMGVGMSVLAVMLSGLKTMGTLVLILVVVGSCAFTLYAPYLILDRQMSAINAIRTSCGMASKNLGQTCVSILALGAISLAGGLFFGVGLFVTGPLTMIALASIYMSVQGEISAE